MASVTLATLRSRVYTRASALTTDTGLLSTVVDGFINEALRQVTAEQDWFWLETSTTFTTVANDNRYDVPTNYMRTEGIVFEDDGTPLALVPKLDVYRYTGAGRPVVYSLEGGEIVLGPTPDGAYTLRHLYVFSEPELTADGQAALVPDEFSTGVVEYATYLCLRFLRQEDRAGEAYDAYGKWLRRARDNRIRTREPMRIRVRPGNLI